MSLNYKYFVIPFEKVPAAPAYTAWFATWSKERPVLEPGMNPPMVVGVTDGDKLPEGALLLGGGSKDPAPPPPPPPPFAAELASYVKEVSAWLASGRDQDE